MIQRFLLLSAFVLFFSIIGDTPRSLAATNDPASIVGDLGGRAICSPCETGIRRRPSRSSSASCSVSISTWKPAPVLLSGHIGVPRPRHSGRSSSSFTRITSSSAIPPPSAPSAAQASRCSGASPIGKGSIVSSRVQINGGAPIRVDWRLNPTNHGYKVTDVIVNGISTASTQHSDLVSVIQRHDGHVPSLLVAMREKNASNGILR